MHDNTVVSRKINALNLFSFPVPFNIENRKHMKIQVL